MKRSLVILATQCCLALAACTQSTPSPTSAAAPPATPPPAAKGPQAPPPSPEAAREAEKLEKAKQALEALAGQAQSDAPSGSTIVVNPKTGQRELRLTKSPQYYVVRGRLYNGIVRDRAGTPLLHEDDQAYYIEAPPEAVDAPQVPEDNKPPVGDEVSPPRLIEIPVEEAEQVLPPEGKARLHLVDTSEGLPITGLWRENFALADMDGDGRPEIVAPPPRLSGQPIRIFKLQGTKWISLTPQWDDPEAIGFEYGGVAVGDLDGDGRPDIAFGKHGGGPAIAFNRGGLQFHIETRGLPKDVSTRAVVLGDIDGDGKLDVLTISDLPEYMEVRRAESEGNSMARQPKPNGYLPGFDIRAFLARGDRYVESHAGLEGACFGYALAVSAEPLDGGAPFLVSSCRYRWLSQIVYEYDRKANSFKRAAEPLVERYSYHMGAAVGTYMGFPAAYESYFKNSPSGASRKVDGNGVTAYYRTPSGWKSRRVLKTLDKVSVSSGLAVGDLDGDGLDDVAYADDNLKKVRVFFQRADGSYEELPAALEPSYLNHATSVRIADMDGDGRKDIVVMSEYPAGAGNQAGGFKVFRNVR